MSVEPGPQFDLAEFENAPAIPQCATCGGALQAYYYEANGATVCEACRNALEAELTAGSGGARAVRAIAAGTAAAVLGALLYYAIGAFTGYEFGLIAIVVGYAVGAAVRWGSNSRGGWRYQALAMLLTYLAIVGIYAPAIARAAREGAAQPAAIVANAMATPFLAGFQNIIGVIIIGIGLYEAWKLNSRTTLTITGPHAIAAVMQV